MLQAMTAHYLPHPFDVALAATMTVLVHAAAGRRIVLRAETPLARTELRSGERS